MRRRKAQQEVENHERWLVSYADFITLLFAFFVVMYSVSSVNEGKYRVLSDSISTAFRNIEDIEQQLYISDKVRASIQTPDYEEDPDLSNEPELFLTPLRPEFQNKTAAQEDIAETDDTVNSDEQFSQQVLSAAETEIDGMATDVEEEMDSLIDDELIKVKRNKFWLEVEIKSSLLFPSGASELIGDAEPVLVELAKIFVDLPNRINIEGFTDNRPISTNAFPTNWELSAARAAAVVRLFERQGVDPSRLAAIGYGEYHPVGDNTTEAGRSANRRVVVVVMASLEGRQDERIYEFDAFSGLN